MNDRIDRLKKFCEMDLDCKCFDGTFDEFNKCCGKKYDIENPLEILFDTISDMSKESKIKRIKDMEPEQAEKTLNRIFEIIEERNKSK